MAPDSFKGTFDAGRVAEAIGDGIEAAGGEADRCPVADGGEGTMAVLLGALGGELRSVRVRDPLRRPIEAGFALLAETAVVEVAQASGLPLLAPEERDPERADTYGTGELIAAAVAAGAKRVIVAAGGSATTDGGRGAIEALRRSDAAFVLLRSYAPKRTNADEAAVGIEVLCDVGTPFEEAARVFAPQKGAGPEAVERLSARLEAFAAELPRDPRGLPMSGCAGGLGGGLWAHGAELRPGAEFVLDALDFDARLARADSVVSGEGRFDSQSLEGKVVGAIADRCAAAGKPLHLIVGQDQLDGRRPAGVDSIVEAQTLEAIRSAGERLAA